MPTNRIRTFAILLALGASFGLAACGGSSTTSTVTTSTTVSEATSSATTSSAPPPVSPATAAAYKSVLASYAACMRRNGIPIAPPTTNAHGEPSLTNGSVDTSGKPFIHALGKCRTFARKVIETPRS